MTVNPADGPELRLLSEVYAEIRALKARVLQLEGTRGTMLEVAQVTAYITSSSTCTVTYPNYAAGETTQTATFTGATRVLVISSETPIVGSKVLVGNSPGWSGVILRVWP